MRIKRAACKFFASVIFSASLISLSGCDSILPESWNDPAYFGDPENFGKSTGTAGTGFEKYKFDY